VSLAARETWIHGELGYTGSGSPSPQVSWYKSVNLSSSAIVDVHE